MGMFDMVKCRVPLPDCPPEVQGGLFQSKSFDCLMQRYVIEADGRIAYYPHGEEQQPQYPYHDLTGSVNIYESAEDNEWYEYILLYRHGKLLSVDRIPDAMKKPEGTSGVGEGNG